jgi:hypothetical protein
MCLSFYNDSLLDAQVLFCQMDKPFRKINMNDLKIIFREPV